MKYILLILLIFGSCKSKNTTHFSNKTPTNQTCPKEGNCTYEILKNKKMSFNFDAINGLYPTFLNADKMIFKFEYKKNNTPNIADSGYREEVFIELNPLDLEFETTHFNTQKILFARWCFCKGEAGYYKIQQGKLSVKKLKNTTYQLDLNFKMDKVPQIITQISYVFTL